MGDYQIRDEVGVLEELVTGDLDAHDGGAAQPLVEERDGDDRAVEEVAPLRESAVGGRAAIAVNSPDIATFSVDQPRRPARQIGR